MVFSFPYVCLKNSLGKHFWTFVICKKSNWTKGILPAVRNKHQIPSETRSTRIAYIYLWFPQFRVASLGSLCPSQFGGNLYYVLLQTWKPKLSGVVTILCSVHLTHQGFFSVTFLSLNIPHHHSCPSSIFVLWNPKGTRNDLCYYHRCRA